MKRIVRLVCATAMLTMGLSAFAQPDTQPTEAQKTFGKLKTLEGTWHATITTEPKMPDMEGGTTTVTIRVTSMGNAMVHEMQSPEHKDHPVTMFYLDDGKLLLTHYCDAGNRPRMAAKASADGKRVDFEFVDISGSTQYGHMEHAAFTFVDADHHQEEWTFLMPGDKPVKAHFELERVK